MVTSGGRLGQVASAHCRNVCLWHALLRTCLATVPSPSCLFSSKASKKRSGEGLLFPELLLPNSWDWTASSPKFLPSLETGGSGLLPGTCAGSQDVGAGGVVLGWMLDLVLMMLWGVLGSAGVVRGWWHTGGAAEG